MEFNATFIVSAISFIVFAFIMNAIFYKPLQRIVQERKNFVDKTNEEAEKNFNKSESILKDKNDKLENTRHDAKKIILDKSEEMKNKKAEMTKSAQDEASSKIDMAKTSLNSEKENAQKELSSYAKTLAEDISSKILG